MDYTEEKAETKKRGCVLFDWSRDRDPLGGEEVYGRAGEHRERTKRAGGPDGGCPQGGSAQGKDQGRALGTCLTVRNWKVVGTRPRACSRPPHDVRRREKGAF